MSTSDQDESGQANSGPQSDDKTIRAFFGFSALYPVFHYVLNNLELFTVSVVLQFALVAMLAPLAAWCVLHFVVRRFAPRRVFLGLSWMAALAIFAWAMQPFLRQFPVWLSRTLAVDLGARAQSLVWVPLVLLLFSLGVRHAAIVAMFLSTMLLVTGTVTAFSLLTFDDAQNRSPKGRERENRLAKTFENEPNIYVFVLDGYLNQMGLDAKGLSDQNIGSELEGRGFHVYKGAFANYKPSVPSMASFFNVQHHYYRIGRDWEDQLTGENSFYRILRSNGYTTVTAHPSDFLLRGHCKSDFCYPSPSLFGQLGFVLAQTIFYRPDFTEATAVGVEQYQADFYSLLKATSSPSIFYSHFSAPSHGPNGCNDPQHALDIYANGLKAANEWIRRTVDEIESADSDAIIVLMGDHGPFLADHCTWKNPNARSRETVIDNLGVLLAVRWPEDYDGRYDDRIHSPMDLSWYLLQLLSGDVMSERDKPASASYLANGEESLIYEVVRDGQILSEPEGVSWSEAGALGLRERDRAPAAP